MFFTQNFLIENGIWKANATEQATRMSERVSLYFIQCFISVGIFLTYHAELAMWEPEVFLVFFFSFLTTRKSEKNPWHPCSQQIADQSRNLSSIKVVCFQVDETDELVRYYWPTDKFWRNFQRLTTANVTLNNWETDIFWLVWLTFFGPWHILIEHL